MTTNSHVSVRQACQAVNLPRSSYSYKPKPKHDEDLIDALNSLVSQHPSIGFWKCFHRLKRQGHRWNHKRVYRVYTQMRLNIRRRSRKRLPARIKQHLFQPCCINQVWSLDYMSDTLWDGRRIRLLNILDDYNRQILAIEVDTSLPALRIIRLLEQLKESRGLPKMIRSDNGPEFLSTKLGNWCKGNDIEIAFIQPGKPTQNAYVERFNGSLRRELLNAHVFTSLEDIRQRSRTWMEDYNNDRPHQSLKNRTPMDLLTENCKLATMSEAETGSAGEQPDRNSSSDRNVEVGAEKKPPLSLKHFESTCL